MVVAERSSRTFSRQPPGETGLSALKKTTSAMLDGLIKLRPFAYHICSALNFSAIKRMRTLRSTADLLSGTPHEAMLSVRRTSCITVELVSGPVEVRDNLPLRPGSLDLEPDCSLEDFLRLLNQRVYFWPGGEHGPCKPGPEHFQRYRGQGAVHILRAPLSSLVSANPDREMEVTFCNAGAARHQGGKPVKRGPSTFRPVSLATGRASTVKELCFVGHAVLPNETKWSTSLAGPWHSL